MDPARVKMMNCENCLLTYAGDRSGTQIGLSDIMSNSLPCQVCSLRQITRID